MAAGQSGRRSRRDEGMSLAELLVSMVITVVLTLAVGTVFVGVVKGTKRLDATTDITADLRIGVTAAAATLRYAVIPTGLTEPLVSGTATSVSFYSSLGAGSATTSPIPTLITYSLTGAGSSACFTETRTPGRVLTPVPGSGAPWAWDTGTTTKCLLRTTTAPAFTYYASAADNAVALSAPLSAGNRALVASVAISLNSTGSSASEAVTSRVTLINMV